MIGLHQFRQFIAVAETLNFRRAAERLNMAQPPLSAAIRRLEEDIGAVLIERGHRVSKLTATGEVFLLEARRAIAQAERAVIVAKRVATGLDGFLRLNCVDSTVNVLLPRILRSFQARHPNVECRVEEASTSEQLIALRENCIDIGLITLPVTKTGEIHVEPLLRDTMIAALPAGHHLAGRRQIDLSDLAEEPWVLFGSHQAVGMHARIVTACAAAGFEPKVVQQPRQLHTALGLVAGGIGVALMPRLFADAQPSGIDFLELTGIGSPILYELAIAYWILSPAVQALRDIAYEVVKLL